MVNFNDASYSTSTLYFLKMETRLMWFDLHFLNISRLNTVFLMAANLYQFKIDNSVKKGRKITSMVENLLRIFFHHGLQTKYLTILSKSISYFYLYFYFFANDLRESHPMYLKMAFSFVQQDFFFLFENILLWFVDFLEPVFATSITRVEKKYRKKFKKKFIHDYVYIFPKKRANFILKNLISYNRLFFWLHYYK